MRDTDLKILLMPHFPRLGDVPVVDAIVFDQRARPVANLSLKTVAAGSAHPPRAGVRFDPFVRQSLANNYHPVRMGIALSRSFGSECAGPTGLRGVDRLARFK